MRLQLSRIFAAVAAAAVIATGSTASAASDGGLGYVPPTPRPLPISDGGAGAQPQTSVQTLGAWMAYGGQTANANYCMTVNPVSDAVSLKQCDEANFSGQFQNFELESDQTIHFVVGGTDEGCLDIYYDDPGLGKLDINNNPNYPCHGNAADAWKFTNAGQIESATSTDLPPSLGHSGSRNSRLLSGLRLPSAEVLPG